MVIRNDLGVTDVGGLHVGVIELNKSEMESGGEWDYT